LLRVDLPGAVAVFEILDHTGESGVGGLGQQTGVDQARPMPALDTEILGGQPDQLGTGRQAAISLGPSPLPRGAR